MESEKIKQSKIKPNKPQDKKQSVELDLAPKQVFKNNYVGKLEFYTIEE